MNSVDMEAGKKLTTRQARVDKLKHLIHKLRWMGLDREAETARAQLSRMSSSAAVSLRVRKPD